MLRDDVGDDLVPVPLPDLSGSNRLVDLIGPLVENAPRTEGVVTDLAVAHVAIRSEPNGPTVGAQGPQR